ncbi:hypothetical protein TrLO_g2533 [Triparma laevis f. longispina]|uniref:Uncharacterized protein n=1 Tax=Triparma laevis f. longispina TaxID=1714387 RepID=A0A9W6ZC94_9STRA|nr:hypothetical protein TrLO_g2533 [Triparma laevis f. longispina]
MATFEGDFVDSQLPPSLVQADSTDDSDTNAPKKPSKKSKKTKKEKKRKVLKPIEVRTETRNSGYNSSSGSGSGGGYQQSQLSSSSRPTSTKTSIPNLYDPRERPSPSQSIIHRVRMFAEAGLDLIGFGRPAHSYSYVPTDEGRGGSGGSGGGGGFEEPSNDEFDMPKVCCAVM